MNIDFQTILVGAVVALLGFLLKRQVVTRMDRIEDKLDKLVETVAEMALKNAEDHAKVVQDLTELRGHIDSLKAPWNIKTRNR